MGAPSPAHRRSTSFNGPTEAVPALFSNPNVRTNQLVRRRITLVQISALSTNQLPIAGL
jgi:hypothetical protein